MEYQKIKHDDYGSTQSLQYEKFDSSSYKGIMIDSMNESIVFQINEQILSEKKERGGQLRTKLHIHNPYWARGPCISRRKSESDLPLLKKDVDEERKLSESTEETRLTKVKVPRFTSQQILILATIAMIDFFTYGAISIMAPFFPSEASRKGVTTDLSGLVFSAYALVIFITSPVMGWISNIISPKVLLLSGITLAGICNLVFGFLHFVDGTLPFFFCCLVVRVFEGLGAAAFTTAGFTFVAEIFPDHIGSVLGILEIFVGLGMSCGPAIGGLLYDWGGYGLPFYCVGGILLLTLPISIAVIPSMLPSDLQTGNAWQLLRLKSVVLVSFVVIVVAITWGFTEPVLEPHLREFHLSAKHLGLFFLLASATYAFSSPVWGYFADKMNRTWILMVIGLLGSSFGLVLLGPSRFTGFENTIWMNVIALTVIGISMSMALLPTFEAMLDYAIDNGYNDGPATYALIGGLWSSMYSLGEVVGPTLGSFLTHHFGFPLCTTVVAGLSTTTAMIVLIYFQFAHIHRIQPSPPL